MIRLAIPGMIMVVAEWLAFEILTLLSSQFGTAYLAAQSILVTVAATMFMIPFPVSVAASTRIANLIGAKLVKAARTSAKVVSLYAHPSCGHGLTLLGFLCRLPHRTLQLDLAFQLAVPASAIVYAG